MENQPKAENDNTTLTQKEADAGVRVIDTIIGGLEGLKEDLKGRVG